MITFDQLFIGGQWRAPASRDVAEVRSPHDQSLVGTSPTVVEADVDAAVAAARQAFDSGPWPRMSPAQRIAIIETFNKLHAERATEIAGLVTSENGTPLWFNTDAQPGVAAQTDAYIRAARAFEWEQRGGGRVTTLTVREPIGVVAGIVPWNAPQYLAMAKAIPALLAGCTLVLKPSPETALDGALLADIFSEAGLPEGVLSILPADREVSEYLVSHPGVDKISFTGSTAAGRRVASIAGSQLKRMTLELGGKSAAIVLDDADADAVAEGIKYAALLVNGQACIAHTRILAPRSRHDEIVEAITAMAGSVTVGDPSAPGTFIGPLISAVQQRKVQGYIRSGVDEGAKLTTGGAEPPEGDVYSKGFYVRPTVFGEVDNSMKIAREEIFGPVLSVIPYADEADAVRIANDSSYGLHGGVWSADAEHGVEIAREVRTGVVSVNGAFAGFDVPFGGY
jgi:aldehyde dehydrogenase (NAD+)